MLIKVLGTFIHDMSVKTYQILTQDREDRAKFPETTMGIPAGPGIDIEEIEEFKKRDDFFEDDKNNGNNVNINK